jgi:hypothetical protein
MQSRSVLFAVVLGLVVGAAGVGLLVATDDDDTSVAAGLPRLPLGPGADRALAAGDPSPVTYRVDGDLPDLARKAKAYRTDGAVTAVAVRRLADGLGFVGRVEETKDGWQVVDGERRLFVASGAAAAWSLGPAEECGPESGVDCAVSSIPVPACPPDRTCKTPPPPPPLDLPSRAEARETALDAFEQAGVDTSGSVEVRNGRDAWDVITERRVDGARTHGYASSLSVGPKGALIRGGGLLGRLDEVGDYPLVSVEDGLKRLRRPSAVFGGEKAMAMGPVIPGKRGEGPARLGRVITDVDLGLMPVYVTDRTWLEPAFLFRFDDKDTVAVPAVVDELLVGPDGGWAPHPMPKRVPDDPGPPKPVPPIGGGGTCSGSAAASSSKADGENQALTVEVCASPTRVRVGETVTFRFKAHDPDAAIDTEGCQQPRAIYGDEGEGSVQCLALCSKDSPPPESMSVERTFTHAYTEPGTYKAMFTVGSCAPKASSGSVAVAITVT